MPSINVHLKGAFNISRAAVPHFRNQNGGSLRTCSPRHRGWVETSRKATMQPRRWKLWGLSHILAMEGAAKNVRSNAIAPLAFPAWWPPFRSRTKHRHNGSSACEPVCVPTRVAPLAIALCSEARAR